MKTKKTLQHIATVAAVLLTLSLVFMMPVGATNVWDGTVAADFAGGDGSVENPFQIATGAQLAYLAATVDDDDLWDWKDNDGVDHNNYHHARFILTDDIDLANKEWTPIGYAGEPFRGWFDGNGHTISNLTITKFSGDSVGLFGVYLGADNQDAILRDLTLENVNIQSEKADVGGLIGFASVNRIENCNVTGNIMISGGERVGGLIGNSYSPVTNCKVEGNPESSISGNWYDIANKGEKIGGLAGLVYYPITGSSVKGVSVSGTGHVGGLVGYLHPGQETTAVTSSSVTETSVTLKYDSNYESYVKNAITAAPSTYDNELSIGALVADSKCNVDDNGYGDTRFTVGIFVDETYKTSTLFDNIKVGFVGVPRDITVTVNNHDLSPESVTNLGTLGLLMNFGYYTVTFNSIDGSAVDAQFVKSGEKATEPSNPTKEGHTFAGWYLEENLYDFTAPVTDDITLTAKWIVNDYTIIPSVDKVGFDSVKVGYTQPDAQEVIITNKGNVPVTLTATATSGKYDVTVTPATEIGLEGTAKVTIKPKAGLPVGNYADTLTIQVAGTDEVLTIPVSFLVYQPSSGGSSTTKPEEPVEPETPVEPENPTEEPEAGEPTVETEVTDGGEVLFEAPVEPETPGADTPSDEPAEPTVTGVELPAGTDSEVAFIPVSEKPAPAGKETQTKKVFEINVPKYEKGKPATVKFTMTVAELAADGKTAADVALWHQDEETGEWTKLVTTFVIIDGVVYFEAITFDFSPFAIVYEDVSAPTEPETPEQPTESPAPILAVLAGLGAAVVLRRK